MRIFRVLETFRDRGIALERCQPPADEIKPFRQTFLKSFADNAFNIHIGRLVNHLPVSETLRMKLQDLLLNFVHGLSGITQGHYVVKAMATSVAVWIAEGTNVYCIVHAFPIAISYAQAYFVLFFLGLSVTLPQAPGYVGTVELFGVMALSLLGIPKEKGLPVILTIHGIQFCFIGSLGCLALWKEGLSLGKLLNCSEISPEK